MIAIPIALAIAGIAGLMFYAYDESDGFQPTANSIFSSGISVVETGVQGLYKLKEDFNEAGDSVAFFAPKQVQQGKANGESSSQKDPNILSSLFSTEQHPDMDAGYDINQATDAKYFENGTEIPQVSTATGLVSDTSYTRERIQQNRQLIGDNGQMLVQIGNIATINGQITILNPETKKPVEPQIYDYWITIDCSDLNEFCNMDAMSQRGITDVGGTFIEKWSTSFRNHEGLYDVKIMAESETTDSLGKKYSIEGLLQIELFK